MEQLRQASCTFDLEDCLKASARSGNISTTKWLLDNFDCDEYGPTTYGRRQYAGLR